MPRLLIYHNNVTSFDELTKFNSIHFLNLQKWDSYICVSEFNTLDSNNYLYLLLTEWLFSQQSKVKQDKKNNFVVKNKATKKYIYIMLDYISVLNILNKECLTGKNKSGYIFYLTNNWLPIFDSLCKLNLDSNILNSNCEPNVFFVLKSRSK